MASDGNHDQRLFVYGWAERYEGYPVGSYHDAQAVRPYAPELRGKLLLIHGMLDKAAMPAALFQLVQAMTDANKDSDMLLQPRLGRELNDCAWQRVWDHFTTNLAGETPPAGLRLETSGGDRADAPGGTVDPAPATNKLDIATDAQAAAKSATPAPPTGSGRRRSAMPTTRQHDREADASMLAPWSTRS